MYDVVVVGAGPAGSVAARRCARAGLKTLIIERCKLPRSKCCGGLLWPETVEVLEKEYSEIPKRLLIGEPLKGRYIHSPSGTQVAPPFKMLNIWRSEFDFWLTEEATKSGSDLWESTFCRGIAEEDNRLVLSLKQVDKETRVEAKIVIGADGSGSSVRRLIYPDVNLDANIRRSYRPYYKGKVDLDLNYLHVWLKATSSIDYATLVPKGDDLFILSASATPSENIKQKAEQMRDFVAKNCGFTGSFQFAEGCATYSFLLERGPMLGKGNVILIGEACGLKRAYGEGIFPAVNSGIEAGKAALESITSGIPAAEIYPAYVDYVVEEAKQSLRGWQQKRAVLAGTPV